MALSQQRGLTRETEFNAALDALPSDFSLQWGLGLSSQEVREKAGFIIEPIEAISEVLTEAIDAISLIVEILAAGIDVLSVLVGVAIDITEGFVLLIREILQQIREIFIGTSVHAMFYFPYSVKERKKPNELLYDIGMSYLDLKDPKRPITTRNNYAVALVAMFSLPNIDALLKIADRVRKAFSAVGDTKAYTSRASSTTYRDPAYIINGTSGMAPDWDYSYSLSEFAWAQAIVAEINKAITALVQTRPIAEKFNAALALVRQRLEALRQVTQTLLQAVQSLQTMLALGEAQAVFMAAGKGDNQDFASAIINAPNHPAYPKTELGEPEYSSGGPVVRVSPVVAQSLMYSGAITLHLQVGVGDNLDRLRLFMDLIFKPVGGDPFKRYEDKPTETAITQAIAEFNSVRDRANQFDRGEQYTNVWRARRDVPRS